VIARGAIEWWYPTHSPKSKANGWGTEHFLQIPGLKSETWGTHSYCENKQLRDQGRVDEERCWALKVKGINDEDGNDG
jgi:hypothetical protein